MSENAFQHRRTDQTVENGHAITVEFQGEADLTIRPCLLPPRPESEPLEEPRTIMVEFEGGEEDLTIRPIALEFLEKILHFKPRV